ncbi:hypothetical protein Taro_053711 [Colocasia esculenta]|uniref:Uncharacterized protein n=1 Tax=Colocasia esculenta TaxID=4460 RepID=A0A843XP16_COLES|nr:hypothetical protein [Colocasia esculenta]
MTSPREDKDQRRKTQNSKTSVMSRAFRIHADHVCSGCDGRCEAMLRPVRGRRTRIKYVIGLTGLAEVFHHSWYQSKKISGMADRRDWGGRGDDLEESTQRMIERIWESLTDIRARMDQ